MLSVDNIDPCDPSSAPAGGADPSGDDSRRCQKIKSANAKTVFPNPISSAKISPWRSDWKRSKTQAMA